MARTLGCLLLLVLLGMMDIAAYAQQTITVPDDYPTIQAAIDAAQAGDTVYVKAGRYVENLTITKPLHLIGEDRTKVIIQSRDPDQEVIGAALGEGMVVIEGLEVAGGSCGIYVSIAGRAHVEITNIICYRNQYGIHAVGNGQLTLAGSYLIDSDTIGLTLGVRTAHVSGNEVLRGGAGILLFGSSQATLDDNLIGWCEEGIGTYTTACVWDPGEQEFDGSVTGVGNRIYGLSEDLCPEFPGAPWPEGFADIPWYDVVDGAVSTYNYGVDLDDDGDYQGALHAYAAGLASLTGASFPLLEAYLNQNIGNVYDALGQYEDALAKFQAAREVFASRGMEVDVADIDTNIGVVYDALGRYEDALAKYEAARAVYASRGMEVDVADIDTNIGVAYRELGRYEDALVKYEAARAVYADHGMEVDVADVDTNIGIVYWGLGQYEDALVKYEAARVVYADHGMEVDVADVDTNIGIVYWGLGQYEDALAKCEAAQAVYADHGMEVDVSESAQGIGVIYMNLHQYEDALAKYQEAISILDKIPPTTGMRYSYPATRWIIYNNMGIAQEGLQEWDAAVTAYQDSIAVIESLRGYMKSEEIKTAWQEKTQDVYEHLIKLLIDHGQGASAFPYAERCRARTFLDALYQGSIKPNQLINPEAGISSSAVDPVVIDAAIASGQKELKSNEAVLEYFVTDDGIYLWVITKDGISTPIFIEYAREQLMTDVITLRKSLESDHPDQITMTELLASFYTKLVKPALDELNGKGVDTLILIPSGPLWYLPFSALQVFDQASGTTTYLIEQYTLAYLPSLASLSSLTKEETQSPSTPFMALANPTLSAEQIKELGTTKYQYAQLEGAAEAMRQRLAGKQEDVYVQGQAREPQAYQEIPVHTVEFYGCHGKFNPKVPLQSKLFLGPGESGESSPDDQRNPDGNYHAWEALLTDHRGTELVILGACESLLPAFYNMQNTLGTLSSQTSSEVILSEQQLKQIVVGDEVVGLARAFLSSGAEAVLGTLWQANPKAIEEVLILMADYHNQGDTWVQALTKAQRDLIKNPSYSNPWFWAPYQLIGRWR